MADQFLSTQPNINSSAQGALVVTPHNTTALSSRIRGLTINVAGTVSFIGWDDTTYTTDTLPVGTYAIFATHIRATGTTATGLTGWL